VVGVQPSGDVVTLKHFCTVLSLKATLVRGLLLVNGYGGVHEPRAPHGVNVGVGVAVGVKFGVGVGVFVGVEVGVFVGVDVGVFVGVEVGVFVGVDVGVFVGVEVGVEVDVGVDVAVGVVVGVAVGMSQSTMEEPSSVPGGRGPKEV
jgi:hypothetical protein